VQINNNTQDYFRANGIPYVVGESAERHGLITQRTATAEPTTIEKIGLSAAHMATINRTQEKSLGGGLSMPASRTNSQKKKKPRPFALAIFRPDIYFSLGTLQR
jgi:hypothetical protein